MLARLDSERSRTLLLLVALMAAALALDLWQVAARRVGRTAWFESAVCSVAHPLQAILTGSIRFAEQEWAIAVGARKLVKENAQLRARVAGLEHEVSALAEERLAASRTGKLLGALPPARPGCVARVIGLGESGWSALLTVDAGSARGVRQRDVAVTAAGVVGQVVAVTAHSARVLPITEPASAVAVRVQRSRQSGILKGSGAWRCEVRYLEPQADVRPGDVIITSGLGGIFPAGLRVGTVTSVRKDRDAPGKAAEVRPWAEARKIEEVVLVSAQ
ncbi:MAG: rod shape-determining protein MreC [Thermoanaerobaculaceae bacterium]|nr:rod shape-determining protein MreC [Thermoanaerobaculaceae bacterium]